MYLLNIALILNPFSVNFQIVGFFNIYNVKETKHARAS